VTDEEWIQRWVPQLTPMQKEFLRGKFLDIRGEERAVTQQRVAREAANVCDSVAFDWGLDDDEGPASVGAQDCAHNIRRHFGLSDPKPTAEGE
jgi:hypothetical protein